MRAAPYYGRPSGRPIASSRRCTSGSYVLARLHLEDLNWHHRRYNWWSATIEKRRPPVRKRIWQSPVGVRYVLSTATNRPLAPGRRRGGMRQPILATSIRAVWDHTPDISIYMEAVHRLGDVGALVTHAARGISHEGFDAE